MEGDITQLFRMLVEAGAVPGEDFTCDLERQTCRMGERAYILLQLAYPEIDLSAIARRVQPDYQALADQLDQQLGLAFTERLLQTLLTRLETLPEAAAAWYLRQVMGGVEQRTGLPLYELFLSRFPDRQAQVDRLLDYPDPVPCGDWMVDLVAAAGGDGTDVELEGDEVLLSDRALALLTQVWTGDYDLYEEP